MGEGPTARNKRKRLITAGAAIALGAGAAIGATAASASTSGVSAFAGYHTPVLVPASFYHNRTATPIKHLVVIFDENVSFDHYFGTYPTAANTDGTTFTAKENTPKVNGLSGSLLTSNPNLYNPQRLSSSQAATCDQNHGYTAEQKAENGGLMNQFVQYTNNSTCSAPLYSAPGLVMNYYDGNTVSALWNYAQQYSMSDNNWDTTFGPSTPGALNVISGVTSGASAVTPVTGQPATTSSITTDGTVTGDPDPFYDQCSDGNHTYTSPVAKLSGLNIGDLLNTKHVTWGWFQGGFTPTSTNAGGAVCGATHTNLAGATVADYSPHHNPFQYYASTANPAHLAPTSAAAIGRTDQANHQYDLTAFSEALKAGSMPAVSYLKAGEYQDGHPGYSDPIDEQKFLVSEINAIEKSKDWSSTAIVITYDDSDGWYDHVAPTIINGSANSAIDAATCSSAAVTIGTASGRCGYSQRLPMVVISPYTRENYVSHNLTDTSSVVKFIEDNWLHGERIPGSFANVAGSLDGRGGLLDFHVRPNDERLILDPATGAVVSKRE
jgi:phospholipase C